MIIASPNAEAAKRAIQMVERLTQVPEIGKIYTGSVRRVEAYGCFVEIMPGTDGLVHISELAPYRVRETSDVVKEGDELTVKVIDIDDTGRVRLSRKAVIVEAPDYDPAQYAGMGMSEDERPPRAEGPPARPRRRSRWPRWPSGAWRSQRWRWPRFARSASLTGAAEVELELGRVGDDPALFPSVRARAPGSA